MMQLNVPVDNELGVTLHHGAVIGRGALLWIVAILLLVLACGENFLDLCIFIALLCLRLYNLF